MSLDASMIRALELPDSVYTVRKVRGRWLASYRVRHTTNVGGHQRTVEIPIAPPSSSSANAALAALSSAVARESAVGGRLAKLLGVTG